jgi:carbonic anhydrase/acetyltransferase-like protein (isoleucine patch superfamily)
MYDGSIPLTRDFMSQTMEFHGQILKRHPNGGGWVPMLQDEDDESMSYVAETVFVGPWAMVYEQARAMGDVQIRDHAKVYGRAYLETDAMVVNHGRICETAWAINQAIINGFAVVWGDARLQGKTQVGGRAQVRDALVCDEIIEGDTVILGNVVKNGRTDYDKFVYGGK